MKNAIRRWGAALLLPACILINTGCADIGFRYDSRLRPVREAFSRIKDGEWIDPQPVSCACKLPDTALEVVRYNEELSVAPLRLRLTTPRKQVLVDSLNQLQGTVHITTVDAALEFVRLRTCSDTVYCWPDRVEQEIMVQKHPGDIDENNTSGVWAILSPKAYRLGGFTPATVQATKSGFSIVRWVWIRDNPDTSGKVQKWRETVLPDGSYRCEILIDKPAPKLPDTIWTVMGRA